MIPAAASDLVWMRHALNLAATAARQQEVPVGAVLVAEDNSILAESANCPIGACDPTAHAEIVALRQGARLSNNYRLINSTLYVTLEPCLMCVGAIVHARVKRVIFGAFDPKAGAVTSVFQLGLCNSLNHKVIYEGGLLAEQSGQLLTGFFRARR
jgi:tRNA(adenine34) deaminase